MIDPKTLQQWEIEASVLFFSGVPHAWPLAEDGNKINNRILTLILAYRELQADMKHLEKQSQDRWDKCEILKDYNCELIAQLEAATEIIAKKDELMGRTRERLESAEEALRFYCDSKKIVNFIIEMPSVYVPNMISDAVTLKARAHFSKYPNKQRESICIHGSSDPLICKDCENEFAIQEEK